MKHLDLEPDSDMTPVIGLLHSMVIYNFERLKRLLAGMTQNQMDYKGPNHDQNSIAQLLRHLTVVDLHWVYRLQSRQVPTELQTKFGPMYDADGKLPTVTNIPLHTLVDEYEQVQAMLHHVCLNITDSDLDQTVPYEAGKTATVRWGIWHVADHSRHHYSNIVQMKKHFRSM